MRTPRGQQRAFYYCDFLCDLFSRILKFPVSFLTRSLEGARTAGLRTKVRRTRVVAAGERARVVVAWERARVVVAWEGARVVAAWEGARVVAAWERAHETETG
jgi:hypothetical protein